MMRFYRLAGFFENFPLFRSHDSELNTSAHIIPVNRVVSSGKNIVLPMRIIRTLVERAHCVAIMSECLCRRGEGCRAYPVETGCLLLGGAARDLDPSLGKIVSVKEALSHAGRAMAMGLVPLVVHNEFDAWMWGIDYRRMLNICFCCDCCCAVRKKVRKGEDRGFFDNIHRLPGLVVSVGKKCDSCGVCAELCMARAIIITSEGARINDSLCKGCGRCVSVCPRGAVAMRLERIADPESGLLPAYSRRTNAGDFIP
jgi:Pyruvate/2-oxoacid:ferredoxin oxidoreductase delta subunit